MEIPELQNRIAPYLSEYHLSGYQIADVVCATSAEAVVFSLKKSGSPDLIIKVKDPNKIRGKSLDERMRKASNEAVEMIRLCENHNVVDIVAHFPLQEKLPYYYCIVEKRLTSMDQYLEKCPKNAYTDSLLAVRLGVDLCNVLYSCQSFSPNYRIIHRDIKFKNLFIDGLVNNGIQLGDFGIAIDIEQTDRCSLHGTPSTMSPEVSMMKQVNHLCDIYSVGILMYYLLNNRIYPYRDEVSKSQAFYQYFFQNIEQRLPPPANGSEELKNAVLQAVRIRKEARWESAAAFFEALSHTPEFEKIYGRTSAYIQSLAVAGTLTAASHEAADPYEEETYVAPHIINQNTAGFISSGTASVEYNSTNGAFIYLGEWHNGYWHGKGEILYPDHRLFRGSFHKGRQLDGSSQLLTDEEYRRWITNAHAHRRYLYDKKRDRIPEGPHVIVRLSSDAVYSGGWQDGKREGYGRLILKDGYTAEGEWKDDCFVSGSCCFNGKIS